VRGCFLFCFCVPPQFLFPSPTPLCGPRPRRPRPPKRPLFDYTPPPVDYSNSPGLLSRLSLSTPVLLPNYFLYFTFFSIYGWFLFLSVAPLSFAFARNPPGLSIVPQSSGPLRFTPMNFITRLYYLFLPWELPPASNSFFLPFCRSLKDYPYSFPISPRAPYFQTVQIRSIGCRLFCSHSPLLTLSHPPVKFAPFPLRLPLSLLTLKDPLPVARAPPTDPGPERAYPPCLPPHPPAPPSPPPPRDPPAT